MLHELVQLRIGPAALVLGHEKGLQMAQLIECLHVEGVVALGGEQGCAQLAEHGAGVLKGFPKVILVLRIEYAIL